jgi:hypothetical protein
MQSVAPHVIKHFIPLEFSTGIIDLQSLPRQPVSRKDDNPLQNMKLRQIESEAEKQLVLTFKNNSSALYKSKRSLKFQHLLQKLGQEQHKISIIKQHMKQSKDTARERELLNLNNNSSNCNPDERQDAQRNYHSYRKIHSEQVRKRGSLPAHSQNTSGSHRLLTGRLHSSINFRETHRAPPESSRNVELLQSPRQDLGKASLRLQIRGRVAPSREVVDHLKRSSTSCSDLVIHINRCDKK